MNNKNQIDRVVSAQGLSRADAAEQVRGRIYEARQYIQRRHKLPPGECSYCDGEKGDFHPPHDASRGCESGGHNHCSCDNCF